MLLFLDDSVLFLEGPDVVAALPPTSTAMKLTQVRTFFDGFTENVEEQADVGRKVNIGLNHKGITAPAEVDIVFLKGCGRIELLPD